MEHPPHPGATGTLRFIVADEHTVHFAEAMPAVLSTPSLVWFLEHAAIEALKGSLEADEVSLGTEINVQHLAPTPLGGQVNCVARLLQVEGTKFLFQVEARDDQELVARGTHRRVVVRASALARRIAAKAR